MLPENRAINFIGFVKSTNMTSILKKPTSIINESLEPRPLKIMALEKQPEILDPISRGRSSSGTFPDLYWGLVRSSFLMFYLTFSITAALAASGWNATISTIYRPVLYVSIVISLIPLVAALIWESTLHVTKMLQTTRPLMQRFLVFFYMLEIVAILAIVLYQLLVSFLSVQSLVWPLVIWSVSLATVVLYRPLRAYWQARGLSKDPHPRGTDGY